MPTRINRLWLPQNAWARATLVLCDKCGEGYEVDWEHVCRKRNSYPIDQKTMKVIFVEVSKNDTDY